MEDLLYKNRHERFTPPPAALVRDIGLTELADALEEHETAAAAAEEARLRAAEEARLRAELAEAKAAKAWLESPAGRAALFQDSGGVAQRETNARLQALDAYLAGLPRAWDLDDEEAAIGRIRARQEADRLRKALWQAHAVAAWLNLPRRIGRDAWVKNHALNDPKTPQAWPLGDLSDDALAGLNALQGTSWSLTPIAELITDQRWV